MNLVFTGSMDWLPNEDAIRYFTEEVFPLVKQEVPNASLTVVGRNPSAQSDFNWPSTTPQLPSPDE